jgi:hypothetical protein
LNYGARITSWAAKLEKTRYDSIEEFSSVVKEVKEYPLSR